jgi:hypothetical protein
MLNRKTNTGILINSTAFFLLAYLFLYIFGQIITIITGILFEYSSLWYYYKVQYFVAKDEWNYDSVKVIFSAVPIFNLIIGLISLVLYSKVRVYEGILKQFFLWVYLLSFTMLFGSVLIGGFFNLGFGHVLNWSYVMDTGRMLYVLIAIVGLISIGYFSGRQVLIVSNTYLKSIGDKEKFSFFLHQILYPFLIGFAILTILKIQHISYNSYFDVIQLALFLIVALFIRLKMIFVNDLYFEEEKKKTTYSRNLLIIVILLLLIYRIGLSFGIPFNA